MSTPLHQLRRQNLSDHLNGSDFSLQTRQSSFAERLGLVLRTTKRQVDHPLWSGLVVKEFADRGNVLSNLRKFFYCRRHTEVTLPSDGALKKYYISNKPTEFRDFLNSYGRQNINNPAGLLDLIKKGEIEELPDPALTAGVKQLVEDGFNDDQLMTLKRGSRVYLLYLGNPLNDGSRGRVDEVGAVSIDTKTGTLELFQAALKTLYPPGSEDEQGLALRWVFQNEEIRGAEVLNLFHSRVEMAHGSTQVVKMYTHDDNRFLMELAGAADAQTIFQGESVSYFKWMQGAIHDLGNFLEHRILYTDSKLDNLVVHETLGFRFVDFGGAGALPTEKEIETLPLPKLVENIQKYLPDISLPRSLRYVPGVSFDPQGNSYNELEAINLLIEMLKKSSFGLEELRELLKKDPHFSTAFPSGMDSIDKSTSLILLASEKEIISRETLDSMDLKYRELVKTLCQEIMTRYEALLAFQIGILTASGLVSFEDWETLGDHGIVDVKFSVLDAMLPAFENTLGTEVMDLLFPLLETMLTFDVSNRSKFKEIKAGFDFLREKGFSL